MTGESGGAGIADGLDCMGPGGKGLLDLMMIITIHLFKKPVLYVTNTNTQ